MEFVTIILAIALVASLAFNFGFIGGGNKPAAAANNNQPVRTESRNTDADGRAAKAATPADRYDLAVASRPWSASL